MKSCGFSLPVIVLYLCGIALGIAGITFLVEASSHAASESAMRNAMTSGITCLSLASVFVLFASILAFIGVHLSRLQQPKP